MFEALTIHYIPTPNFVLVFFCLNIGGDLSAVRSQDLSLVTPEPL